MRKELFWDCIKISEKCEIERAINFGGFDFIDEVIEKYGIDNFKKILNNSRNLSRKSVNYWCYKLDLDRNTTKTFKNKCIWLPFR